MIDATETRGSTRRLHTEEVGCGGCGAAARRRLYSERYKLFDQAVELGINRCERCGLVYVSPRLTPESVQLVYEHDAEHTISHNYCWSGSDSEARFAPLLTRLAGLAPAGRLLDVGCGGGHFLHAAQARGSWLCEGLEPVAQAADQAARYADCTVHNATLEEAGLKPGRYQVVSMLGVLEHFHDPLATLAAAKRLLADDGLLCAYVPNFNYLRLKDAGPICYARHQRWSKLHPQEHLFQYQPQTLLQLLKTAGFEPVRLDVGKPFLHGGSAKRFAKKIAFGAASALRATTGVCIGGLEVIAQKGPSQVTASNDTWVQRAA